MKVIWTPQAPSDLKQAVDYIAKDKPDAAAHAMDRIYQRVMLSSQLRTLVVWESFPARGSSSSLPGSGLSFIKWMRTR